MSVEENEEAPQLGDALVPDEEPAENEEHAEGVSDDPDPEVLEDDGEEDGSEVEAVEDSGPEPEQPAPEPARDPGQHDPITVQRAAMLGMPPQQMAMFTPQGLQQAVAWGEQAARNQAGRKPAPGQLPDKFDIGLDKEEYDEKYVEVLEQMRDFYDGRIGELKETIQNMEMTTTRASLAIDQQQFDAFVESLGDEYADVLGKGPSEEMDQESAEFRVRDKLFKEGLQSRALAQAMNQATPSLRHAWRKALRGEYGTRTEASARKELQNKIKKHSAGITTRPTKSTGKRKLDPEKSAQVKVAALLDKFGAREDEGW